MLSNDAAPKQTCPSGPRRSATNFSSLAANSSATFIIPEKVSGRPMAAEKYRENPDSGHGKLCLPGADAVGQGHQSYPANTYILRVRAPVLFPEQFYLNCFDKGVDGIIMV